MTDELNVAWDQDAEGPFIGLTLGSKILCTLSIEDAEDIADRIATLVQALQSAPPEALASYLKENL